MDTANEHKTTKQERSGKSSDLKKTIESETATSNYYRRSSGRFLDSNYSSKSGMDTSDYISQSKFACLSISKDDNTLASTNPLCSKSISNNESSCDTFYTNPDRNFQCTPNHNSSEAGQTSTSINKSSLFSPLHLSSPLYNAPLSPQFPFQGTSHPPQTQTSVPPLEQIKSSNDGQQHPTS